MKKLNPAIKTGWIKPVAPYRPKNIHQRYEWPSLGKKGIIDNK
nr:hypothetical protein [Arachidicoccus rhizosphaerae]